MISSSHLLQLRVREFSVVYDLMFVDECQRSSVEFEIVLMSCA